MLNNKKLGRSLSVAICAALFGSTMILSAVGPAQASETRTMATSLESPGTARYLA